MYKLILTDGTEIYNLTRLNPSTFQLESQDGSLYWKLNKSNLSFVTLFKDDELEDTFFDCELQAFYTMAPYIEFRLKLI